MLMSLGAIAATAIIPSAGALPPPGSPGLNPGLNDVVDKIQGYGSDTTYPLMQQLDAAFNGSLGCNQAAPTSPYAGEIQNTCLPFAAQPPGVVLNENWDHDAAISYFPQGSSAGRRQLCEQDVPRPGGIAITDYARSSSAPSTTPTCGGAAGPHTFRFVAFARDALTWVKFNTVGGGSTPVTNLTTVQLNEIFVNCDLEVGDAFPTTYWDEGTIGGANHNPIRVWSVQSASGTRATWDGFVGGNSTLCIPAIYKDGLPANGERVIQEHNAAPVVSAVNDADAADEGNSIFYYGFGRYQVTGGEGSILGSVNGIAPTEATIQNATFPFGRFVYNVYRQAGTGPTLAPYANGYIGSSGWICKPPGQHAEPPGTPGVGIEVGAAPVDYGQLVHDVIRSQGFIPLRTDIQNVNRCDFTDVVYP